MFCGLLKKLCISLFFALWGYLIMTNTTEQQNISNEFFDKTGLKQNKSLEFLVEPLEIFFKNIHFTLLLTPLCLLGKYLNFVLVISFLSSCLINFSLNFSFEDKYYFNLEFAKYLLISLSLITCIECNRKKII